MSCRCCVLLTAVAGLCLPASAQVYTTQQQQPIQGTVTSLQPMIDPDRIPMGERAGQTMGGLTVGTGERPIAQASTASTFYYRQINLASSRRGEAAVTIPELRNPWGIAFEGANPFWLLNNGSGKATLHQLDGQPFPSFQNPKIVAIPAPAGSARGVIAAPTGVVANTTSGFIVNGSERAAPAKFIIVAEDGTISAWAPTIDPRRAVPMVDNSAQGAVYKGAALGYASGPQGAGNFLYVTNFANGTVDVFDSRFRQVKLSGDFVDPDLPAGFAPFGIHSFASRLYVTYARQDSERHDHVPGLGEGLVNIFDTDGYHVRRFATGGMLNAPWGLAQAPLGGFGPFSGTLLVGNAGDGRINAYNPHDGEFRGQLTGLDGMPLRIDGLWTITFRSLPVTGIANEPAFGMAQLFFTAGPDNQKNGLFGYVFARPADRLPPGAVPLRAPGGIASPISKPIWPW